jgi:hypothetical protein
MEKTMAKGIWNVANSICQSRNDPPIVTTCPPNFGEQWMLLPLPSILFVIQAARTKSAVPFRRHCNRHFREGLFVFQGPFWPSKQSRPFMTTQDPNIDSSA